MGHAHFDVTPGLQMTNSEVVMDPERADRERALGRAGLEGEESLHQEFTELAEKLQPGFLGKHTGGGPNFETSQFYSLSEPQQTDL